MLAESATESSSTEPSRSTNIEQYLQLLHQPGDVYETRILDTPQKRGASFRANASGYFNDHSKAARLIKHWDSVEPAGIYVTMNPVVPDLLARSANAIRFRAKNTTADGDIVLVQRKLEFAVQRVEQCGGIRPVRSGIVPEGFLH
ncbi:MAG: hypothetical protein AAF714_08970 [Pseudomonadota bacterium]